MAAIQKQEETEIKETSTEEDGKNRRIHTRVFLKKPLRVRLASIGGLVSYQMETSDISHAGFFLDFDRPGRFPFTSESILEVWLALPENKTIFFNGKMARLVLPPDEGKQKETGIAIRIIQISAADEKLLAQFIKAVAPQVVKKAM
jgi:hypothetical protein